MNCTIINSEYVSGYINLTQKDIFCHLNLEDLDSDYYAYVIFFFLIFILSRENKSLNDFDIIILFDN